MGEAGDEAKQEEDLGRESDTGGREEESRLQLLLTDERQRDENRSETFVSFFLQV